MELHCLIENDGHLVIMIAQKALEAISPGITEGELLGYKHTVRWFENLKNKKK